MRKLMWLLPAMALWSATVQAQFGQPYDPRIGGPYVPGFDGRRDPFGPQVPGIPGLPSAHDPFRRSRLFGPPGFPVGRQPWMPPTIGDILNQTQPGFPTIGQRYDPWSDNDPLCLSPGGRVNLNPAIPGGVIPPTSIEVPKIDPILFENLSPPVRFSEFNPKPPAKTGSGPPAWLRWGYFAGVFVLAVVGGLLRALLRRNAAGG